MSMEDFKKDKESGDTERTYVRNTGMSPIERYFTLIEDAYAVGGSDGLACLQSAAQIASGILCGVIDDTGNKKYFIADVGSPTETKLKKQGMVNLAKMFDDIFKIKAAENVNLRFFSTGVKGTVGKHFTIDAKPGTEEAAQRAAINEANRQAMTQAQQKLIPISALLGAEGFVDPLRKLSVAGENLRMRHNIEADMAVYNVFKKDFEEREAQLIKEQAAEIERIKKEYNAKG